jgi:hypothetical protein
MFYNAFRLFEKQKRSFLVTLLQSTGAHSCTVVHVVKECCWSLTLNGIIKRNEVYLSRVATSLPTNDNFF